MNFTWNNCAGVANTISIIIQLVVIVNIYRHWSRLWVGRSGFRIRAATREVSLLQNEILQELDVHGSMHRDIIMKITNEMLLYRLIYYSNSAVHISGNIFVHHQEHLTVFTISGSAHPSCCRLVFWMSSDWTHPRHQPGVTWVNTTRYCKYSQVLLMMGENIARNMYSWLRILK
jgi:hypothetical protein